MAPWCTIFLKHSLFLHSFENKSMPQWSAQNKITLLNLLNSSISKEVLEIFIEQYFIFTSAGHNETDFSKFFVLTMHPSWKISLDWNSDFWLEEFRRGMKSLCLFIPICSNHKLSEDWWLKFPLTELKISSKKIKLVLKETIFSCR